MAGSGYNMAMTIVVAARDLASSVLRGIAGAFGPIGAAVAVAATAVVGFIASSVKMAAQYQQSMNMVQALTGSSGQQMNWYSDQLKALAVNAGVAPNALAQGLYQVISAGYAGKSAMQVLTLATQDSKIGMTDQATTADALTNILKAFSIGANGATVANGQMLETVTLGKSTFAQYAGTITKASTTASQFHISLATMSAAWATMTANSIKAKQASTDFVQVAQSMYAKVGTITTSLHKNGIAFNETAFNAASFKEKVLMLNTALQEARDKHVSVTGVTLQAAQAIQVISQHVGDYNHDLDTLSNKQQMAQKTQKAWAITQSGFSQTMSRVQAALQVLMINIGQALLPVLTKLMNQVVPIITQFSAWITKSGIMQQVANALAGALGALPGILQFIFGAISHLVAFGASVVGFFQKNQWAVGLLMVAIGALGGVLAFFAAAQVVRMVLSLGIMVANMLLTAATTVTSAASMGTAFTVLGGAIVSSMASSAVAILSTLGPFLLAGAVIAAVVVGVVLAIHHWGAISAWLKTAWQNALSWLEGAFHKVESAVQSVIAWFNKIKTPVEVAAGIITAFFLPALIKTGVQAAIAGAKVTAQFIGSMAKTGSAAVINGGKTTASFVASTVKAGVQAVIAGAKITIQFVGSMIKAGVQAVIAGAKVAIQFAGSLIKAGLEGWAAAGKLAVFIGQLIATGARAVWAGIQIAAKFVVSLVQAGIQAVIAGAKIVAGLIPAIISFVAQALAAAATAIPAMIAGFIGWAAGAMSAAAATIAATWPVLLIIAAIALLVVGIILLVKHWGAVVAFLRGIWQSFSAWFMNALHAVGAFFTRIWSGIKSFFVGLWTSIVGFFRAHILLIIAIVTGPLGALVILIVTHWSQIKQFFTQLWSDVVGIFNSAKDWVMNAVSHLWNTISNFFSTLPAKMVQFGKNLIMGLVHGILGAFGFIGNAMHSVVNFIGSFLPHSPAKQGELSHLNDYGPALVRGLATGIKGSTSQLQSAMQALTHPVAASLAGLAGGASVASPGATGVSGVSAGPQATAAAASVAPASMNVTINIDAKYMDAREISTLVQQDIANLYRHLSNSGSGRAA
jgi:TP901 family phage tail tape measure protein